MWSELLPKLVGRVGDYTEETTTRARLVGYELTAPTENRGAGVSLFMELLEPDPEYPQKWEHWADRQYIGIGGSDDGRMEICCVWGMSFVLDAKELTE